MSWIPDLSEKWTDQGLPLSQFTDELRSGGGPERLLSSVDDAPDGDAAYAQVLLFVALTNAAMEKDRKILEKLEEIIKALREALKRVAGRLHVASYSLGANAGLTSIGISISLTFSPED